MTTELLIVIMSIVALHIAALVGGLRPKILMMPRAIPPPSLPTGDAADTAH